MVLEVLLPSWRPWSFGFILQLSLSIYHPFVFPWVYLAVSEGSLTFAVSTVCKCWDPITWLCKKDRIRNSTAVPVSLHSAPAFAYQVETFKQAVCWKHIEGFFVYDISLYVSIDLIASAKKLLWLVLGCPKLTLTFHWPLIRAPKWILTVTVASQTELLH